MARGERVFGSRFQNLDVKSVRKLIARGVAMFKGCLRVKLRGGEAIAIGRTTADVTTF
jgi:hypothetical protein